MFRCACVCVRIHVNVCGCVCNLCAYVYMCVLMYVFMYVCKYGRMYVCTRYVCLYVSPPCDSVHL